MKFSRSRDARTVAIVETSELSVRSHLDGLLLHLTRNGFKVTVLARDSGGLSEFVKGQGCCAIAIPMERNPSILADLMAALSLLRSLIRVRPATLIYGTPKASLLAAVAGFLLGIPRRVYVLHGLRLETLTGPALWSMKLVERLVMTLSHEVVAVGTDLRREAVQVLGVRVDTIQVLGYGSANGVDTARFVPHLPARRAAFRAENGLELDAFYFIFIGRVTRDKGIFELLDAFQTCSHESPRCRLLLLGDMEAVYADGEALRERIASMRDVLWLIHEEDIQDYLAATDCLVLPTYREGLPNVLLEAACAGTPIVATEATGVGDIVRDGETGLLVPIGDDEKLAKAMLQIVLEPEEARRRAIAARELIVSRYSRETVWRHWLRFIRDGQGAA